MFGIDDAIAAGSKLIDDVVTRIWPDATVIEKAKLDQVTAGIQNEFNVILGQLAINQEEAKNPHVFVAGWRPFIGWVGGLGIGYQILFAPIANGLCLMIGIPAPFLGVDIGLLQSVVGGMLGLGIARSVDKSKGVATTRVGK
jgi:hypothetical protein